jgi:hypothetical protein
MRSPTRWTSRALVAAGVGGLLMVGAVFGAGDVDAASADGTPPTTARPDRPGTLPPEPPTTASRERPTRAAPGRPGTLPPAAPAPAEPVAGVPNFTG